MSPDVGTSPDASDTGFEELMDVSDGKGISHLGLFWEIIRSGLYHLIIHLTFILYYQYAYSPYCSLYKFPKVLTRSIFLTIKSILSL